MFTKPQSSYKKLEKAMNEAPKKYEQIKKLIEVSNNDLKNFSTSSLTNVDENIKILPHQKNNIKSKK